MAHDLGRFATTRPDEVALRDDRVVLGWAEVDQTLIGWRVEMHDGVDDWDAWRAERGA